MEENKSKVAGPSEEEIAWDARADRFNEYQKSNPSLVEEQVISFLEDALSLKEARILDIGGGSGRYALPLARRAKEVVMTDFSAKMLMHAKNNAAEAGLDNIRFEKLDWSEANVSDLCREGAFDLVFASMCPPLRREAEFEKMMAASRGHCFINQFIYDKDSVGSFLDRRLGIVREFDPHNDRESLSRFFNEIFKRGFDPQIRYAKDEFEKRFSFAQALDILRKDYGEIAREKGADLKRLLEEYRQSTGAEDIFVEGKTVSAMILWEVRR